jgi:probable F420-dependent oxidoreductase
MADLRFGLHYSCQSPNREWEALYRATLKQVQVAEEFGYDSVSVAEHHFLPDGWVPAPMVMLAGIAAVTDEIKLGTNIVVLPLHHPVRVAEETAVLDLLSGGRFRLGVAIGWRDEEFTTFGVDKRERVKRTEEGIELIRTLLSEEGVTYDGSIYTVEDLSVMPRPVQDPVPIWYGGQSEPAIERAARMADAWSMSPIETRSELAETTEFFAAALERHGRSYDTVHKPLRREVFVAEDDETAWAEVGDALLSEYEDVYGDYEDVDHTFETSSPESAIDELREHADGRFVVGSPETAIRELERYRDAIGVDEVFLRMHFPGLDPELAEKSMRILADEVMPHFE